MSGSKKEDLRTDSDCQSWIALQKGRSIVAQNEFKTCFYCPACNRSTSRTSSSIVQVHKRRHRASKSRHIGGLQNTRLCECFCPCVMDIVPHPTLLHWGSSSSSDDLTPRRGEHLQQHTLRWGKRWSMCITLRHHFNLQSVDVNHLLYSYSTIPSWAAYLSSSPSLSTPASSPSTGAWGKAEGARVRVAAYIIDCIFGSIIAIAFMSYNMYHICSGIVLFKNDDMLLKNNSMYRVV